MFRQSRWTPGEDFGQKIDLTVRIREILRNYPEGTSILKELVQNADDAGAREVRLCLDLRRHGTDGLPSPALAQFQGPALLVYNDGVFTDTDFRYDVVRASFLPLYSSVGRVCCRTCRSMLSCVCFSDNGQRMAGDNSVLAIWCERTKVGANAT